MALKGFLRQPTYFFEIERQNILFSVEKSEVSFDVFWEIYLIKLSVMIFYNLSGKASPFVTDKRYHTKLVSEG